MKNLVANILETDDFANAQAREECERRLRGALRTIPKWRNFPGPSMARVFLAGVVPRHGTTLAWWWTEEGVTDTDGMPFENADAIRWAPIPLPPAEDPDVAARADGQRSGSPPQHPAGGSDADERAAARALVEAGYMPLADYVAKYGDHQ